MVKKKPKYIGAISRPIIIVGEKMGQQRTGSDTYALEGNRTGDFVHEAIDDRENIVLTNIDNHFYPGIFDHKSPTLGIGIADLIELFEEVNPSKIITLGSIAKEYIASIVTDCEVINLPHPSWINRFHSKNRSQYVKQLTDALDK